MAKSLLTPTWYRVADLRLKLRGHAEIHRQRFRGEVWYILQDHQTGRFHRMSPAANLIVAMMDGRRTLDEIWNLAGARFGDDPPTQDETIQLLSQLHASDLLMGEVPPDFRELGERSAKQARSDILSRLRNPLALRLPLFDPDAFLDATMPLLRPIFSVWGFLAWLALIATGLTVAALNWDELAAHGANNAFSAGNLLLIVAIYPLVKTLHETGHAYATKAWGGAVHEVGIMLLVLMPAPYVDATSATAFREKWRRIVVSGAGIMVEFGLAAAAAIFWVNAEPGLARTAAFNVMLIGTISTVFFNGNPLLRFDAYYILTDLIEVPNLGNRANKYFWYLVQYYLLDVETADNPASARGEHRWLFAYALAAFCYRVFLSLAIALIVASQLFFVGVLLAFFTLFHTFVLPLFKGAKFIATSPRLTRNRGRAVAMAAMTTAVALILLLVVPLPYRTISEGVVWMPEGAEVRAGSAGVVAEVLARPGSTVSAGTPLLRIEDPALGGRVAVLEAQKHELQLRFEATRFVDRVQGEVIAEQLRNVDSVLAAVEQRRQALTVRAQADGLFILPRAADLPGRFANQGELLGYVTTAGIPSLRVVVPQYEADLVRARTLGVEVRYSNDIAHAIPARITREVPAAQRDLPSLALAVEGGGSVATDARTGDTARALEGLFLFDVQPGQAAPAALFGSRAYVRFDHGSEALVWRLVRLTRQVFLSRFDV